MRYTTSFAIAVLAVSSLAACNRGQTTNNSVGTSANAAAPVAPATTAAPAADASTGPAAFRLAAADQCETQVRANPNVPAGLDVTEACACASDTALSAQADPATYMQTPQGQQAFAQSLAQCLQRAAGAMAPGTAPAAEGEGAGDATE